MQNRDWQNVPTSGGVPQLLRSWGMESQKFRFKNIEPVYMHSREINAFPKPRVWAGVWAADVECKDCGHRWHAQRETTSFTASTNAVFVTCAGCKAREEIRKALFQRKQGL